MQEATARRAPMPTESVDREVPFSFDELFFSRTDPGGIILSGNSVFQRISHYSWDELINKPHKIIRHPDMPRAVFYLLWETIKDGRPIGAYVKNRAKDGRYYWVFAIVTPISTGYLSVRLKPSALLSVVEEKYKALSALEADRSLRPKDSAAILMEELGKLGFGSYDAFMAYALSSEITARDARLQREADPMIARFDLIQASAKSLLEEADAVFKAFARSEYVPLNLSVQAAQLGEGGAAIGVISSNYNLISDEIKSGMRSFLESARQVLSTVDNGLFLLCTAKVQQELVSFFQAEASTDDAVRAQETGLLHDQQQAYQERAVEGLRAISQQAGRFLQDCSDMKKLASSLMVTRVMGKIESSHLKVEHSGVDKLMDDLDAFQAAIAGGLAGIVQRSQRIQHDAQQMLVALQPR